MMSFFSKKRHKNKWLWWGNLRRLAPVSDVYGLDRGQSLDRYYIDNFIDKNKKRISGKVVEIRDSRYTDEYGEGNVTKGDILDIDKNNKEATIICDLSKGDAIEANSYDAFILTQTLQYIYDLKGAIYHIHRVLRPGGSALVTLPSVSRIDCVAGIKGDYWRFTKASAEKLFLEFFEKENVKVEAYGNVFIDMAFLAGLATHEIKKREFDYYDENFPLVVCVRAVK